MARRKLRFRLKQKPGEKGIFLPERVLESLAGATEAELKLLLLLAKEGRDKDYVSESDLLPTAEKAGIDRETFVEAMAFFRGAGLVENEERTEEKSAPKTEPVPEEKKEDSTPTLPVPRRRAGRSTYTSSQLAEAASAPEFLQLVDFASRTLKKTFNTSDVATLYSFTDSLCLPYDVIMLGIEHCVTEGKMSLRYVEKLLLDFADREINTYEKAEEYIRARVAYKSFEGKIRTMLGLGQRSLTAKEKAMISAWQNDFRSSDELIELAYEKTVQNTSRPSMSYMHKILENWHTAGFESVAAVEAGDRRPDSATGSVDGFDPEEFFRVAVDRAKKKDKEERS